MYDDWEYGADRRDFMSTRRGTAAQYYGSTSPYYWARRAVAARADRPSTTSTTNERPIKQTAVFGELTYDLTEGWTVTGGARWFEFDRNESTSLLPQGVPADFDAGSIRHGDPMAGSTAV